MMNGDKASAKKRGRLLAVALCGLVLALGLTLAGCKYSDYTTERIYDQNSDLFDEEVTLPVNSLLAEETSEDLPQIEIDYNAEEDNSTSMETPVAGEGDSPIAVPQVEYDIEADDSQYVDSPNVGAIIQNNPLPQGVVGETSSVEQKTSEGEGDASSEESSAAEGPGSEGEEVSGTGSAKRSASEKKVYSDYGEYPEIPEGVEHVAAVGSTAITVEAVAQPDALLASDASFLQNDNICKVFADRNLDEVAQLWDEEGNLADIEMLVSLDIQLIFVAEGDSVFTESEEQRILDEGIIIYVLPDMSTVKEITTSISIVGQIMDAGGDAEALSRANELVDFYDTTIAALKDKLGGNVAGGYDYETGESVESLVADVYSLYISEWDNTARYSDANGYVTSDQGVGIAELGSTWSPLSYLMSVGGVINNAARARFSYLDGYSAFVWQFNQNKVSADYSLWSNFDTSLQDYRIQPGDGFTETLLWSMEGSCGLGSSSFPKVIVRTQAMRSAMLQDASRSNGLYHPYPSVTSGSSVQTSIIGFYANGILCDACIGTSGDAFVSELNDGNTIMYYDVEVNPYGLFSSWTDGSLESVLEAAWIYKIYYDNAYDIEGLISEFYSLFYGYELDGDELATILAGPVS